MADTIEELKIQILADLTPIRNLNKEISQTKNAIATLSLSGKEGTKNFEHFNQRLTNLKTIQKDLNVTLGANKNAFTMLSDSVNKFGSALMLMIILSSSN